MDPQHDRGKPSPVVAVPSSGAGTATGHVPTATALEVAEAASPPRPLHAHRRCGCLRRTASLKWLEKAFIVFDAFQVFGLLWAVSQPWPWPYLWYRYTRYAVVVNADVLLLSKNGAHMGMANSGTSLWGEMSGALHRYALPIGLAPVAISLLLYRLVPELVVLNGRWEGLSRHASHVRIAYWRYWTNVLSVRLGYVVAVPCTLAALRLLDCDGDSLDIDPDVTCGGELHVLAATFTVLASVVGVLALGLVVAVFVADAVVYRSPADHEKTVQRVELEWELGITDEWLRSQLWLVSSFKRRSVYHYVLVLAYKLLLVACYTLVRGEGMIGTQGTTFVVVLVAWWYYLVARRPYRLACSNALAITLQSLLVVQATLGLFTGYGVSSALLVSSTLTLVLAGTTALLLLLALLILAACACCERWPTVRTRKRLEYRHADVLGAWVEAVRAAQLAAIECRASPPLTAPVHRLEQHMRILHGHWIEAKTRGSILELTLSNCLEELSQAHEACCEASMFPDTAKLEVLDQSVFHVQERFHSQLLMAPRKRSILNKLLAARFLMSPLVDTTAEVDDTHEN